MKKTFQRKRNGRGFAFRHFKDRNGVECSIQKSSIATEDAIWLGPDSIGLKSFVPFRTPTAWKDHTDEEIKKLLGAESIISNTRMHLTRANVKKLLPVLKKFVETGEV